jgi:hypothetical protein
MPKQPIIGQYRTVRPAISVRFARLADRRSMTTFMPYDVLPPARLDPLRMAAAAYLARYKGQSRTHTECDLRAFLRWCVERAIDPLNTTRPYIELCVRWMQEERHYAPSTVSRRLSTVDGGRLAPALSTAYSSTPPPSMTAAHPVTTLSPTLGLSHRSSKRCSTPPSSPRTPDPAATQHRLILTLGSFQPGRFVGGLVIGRRAGAGLRLGELVMSSPMGRRARLRPTGERHAQGLGQRLAQGGTTRAGSSLHRKVKVLCVRAFQIFTPAELVSGRGRCPLQRGVVQSVAVDS